MICLCKFKNFLATDFLRKPWIWIKLKRAIPAKKEPKRFIENSCQYIKKRDENNLLEQPDFSFDI